MFVKATEIKNSFGKYLKLLDEEDIVIVKNGTPVARMTSYECWDEADRRQAFFGFPQACFSCRRRSYATLNPPLPLPISISGLKLPWKSLPPVISK